MLGGLFSVHKYDRYRPCGEAFHSHIAFQVSMQLNHKTCRKQLRVFKTFLNNDLWCTILVLPRYLQIINPYMDCSFYRSAR